MRNPMSEFIHGTDVSSHQGNINFGLMANPPGYPPNKFIIIRAGYAGTAYGNWADPKFQQNIDQAPAFFPVIGCYWFFVPRLSEADAVAQANKFWQLVQGKVWHFLAVDVEAQPWGYTVSPADFQKRLRAFLDRMEELSGVKCLIYTRETVWTPWVGAPAWADAYDLWAARYIDIDGPWADGYYEIFPWAEDGPGGWHLHQWSADKPPNYLGPTFGAESSSIDRNRFKGSWTEFETWVSKFGKYQPPPPPPPPPPADLEARVVTLEGEMVEVKQRLDALESGLENVKRS